MREKPDAGGRREEEEEEEKVKKKCRVLQLPVVVGESYASCCRSQLKAASSSQNV